MEGKIYSALGKINAEVGAIGKDQTNTQQGFKFRGIDDFMNTLHGLFAKHNVIILPSETEAIQERIDYVDSYGKPKMQFRSRIHFVFTFVSTEDGSSVTADGWGESADNGDKGYNKCKSIALKYVLMQVFLVPTADIADPDKETPDEIPAGTPKSSPTTGTSAKDDTDYLGAALKAIAGAKTKAELDKIYATHGKNVGYCAPFIKAINEKANGIK